VDGAKTIVGNDGIVVSAIAETPISQGEKPFGIESRAQNERFP